MLKTDLMQEAGLTEGETKVYLALLKLGSSTAGPVVKNSGVANSIIYKILNGLVEKGLASFITKEKTKYFQAADPKRILDYIEEKREKLNESKQKIENIIPQLLAGASGMSGVNVQIFEGFKGFLTAWELCYSKLGKGDEYHSWGVYPMQEERFHLYWQRDHVRRKEIGFRGKILFNKGTDKKILKNRNGYWGCEARYMPTDIKTPSWFVVYKDVTNISFQNLGENGIKPFSIVITSQEVADTFEAYFQELWERSTKSH